MARTKNEKKKKVTVKKEKPSAIETPHFVLDVHDSTLSSKNFFGKGDK